LPNKVSVKIKTQMKTCVNMFLDNGV